MRYANCENCGHVSGGNKQRSTNKSAISESEFGSIDYADIINEANGSNPVQQSPARHTQIPNKYNDHPKEFKRVKSTSSSEMKPSSGMAVYKTEQQKVRRRPVMTIGGNSSDILGG